MWCSCILVCLIFMFLIAHWTDEFLYMRMFRLMKSHVLILYMWIREWYKLWYNNIVETVGSTLEKPLVWNVNCYNCWLSLLLFSGWSNTVFVGWFTNCANIYDIYSIPKYLSWIVIVNQIVCYMIYDMFTIVLAFGDKCFTRRGAMLRLRNVPVCLHTFSQWSSLVYTL